MSETTFDRPVQWPHRAVFAAVIVAVWLMLLRLVWRDTLAHPAQVSGSLYAYSDWLINYAGGFVRRGLAGELLRRASGGPIAPATLNLVVAPHGVRRVLARVPRQSPSGHRRRAPGRFVPAPVPLFVPGGLYTHGKRERVLPAAKDFLFPVPVPGAARGARRPARPPTTACTWPARPGWGRSCCPACTRASSSFARCRSRSCSGDRAAPRYLWPSHGPIC